MEKKKLIWVILSVTLFFAVIFGGAMYLLKPVQVATAKESNKGEQALSDTGFDVYEYIKSNENPPGLMPEKNKEKTKEMTIVVGENKESVSSGETVSKTETPMSKTINVTETPVKIKTEKSTFSNKTSATKKRVTTKKKRIVKEYWIQAASYTSLTKAENMHKNLLSKGVGSRILSKDVKGKTYYRVRIGPYRSKAEAEKFLGEIKKLEGLSRSYISIVYVKE